MKKIIFVTYDGLLEPLGYSQILSYLTGLSEKYKLYILSFEKENDLHNHKYYEKIKKILSKNNIFWKFYFYKKNNLKIIKSLNFIQMFLYLFFRKSTVDDADS